MHVRRVRRTDTQWKTALWFDSNGLNFSDLSRYPRASEKIELIHCRFQPMAHVFAIGQDLLEYVRSVDEMSSQLNHMDTFVMNLNTERDMRHWQCHQGQHPPLQAGLSRPEQER